MKSHATTLHIKDLVCFRKILELNIKAAEITTQLLTNFMIYGVAQSLKDLFNNAVKSSYHSSDR
jgi:hypothetical protein